MIIKAALYYEKGFLPRALPLAEKMARSTLTPCQVPGISSESYMGKWIEDYVFALKRVGYVPSQVTKIILTHKHSDHFGEIRSFPNAKFYVNRVELTSVWEPLACILGMMKNRSSPYSFRL